MSRFDSDDYDPQFPNEYDLWEANWQRHLHGAGGQKALCDLRDALLALPDKRLIRERLADESGCVCAVAAVALHRRTNKGESRDAVIADLAAKLVPDERWGEIDAYEAEEQTMEVGMAVGLKRAMAVKLAYQNDQSYEETPEQRYERVLRWVESKIEKAAA